MAGLGGFRQCRPHEVGARRDRRGWWTERGAGWLAIAAGLVVCLARPAVAGPPFDPTWRSLVERLVGDGLDREEVAAAFRDPRVRPFTGLPFSLEPREPRSIYRGFLAPSSVVRARDCRARHDRAFRGAERRHRVSASVVGAILHVETQCGRNTGRQLVLYRLARLAMANDPANVRWNLERHTEGLPTGRAAAVEPVVRRRAREIERLFYPEVLATFRMSERLRIDPLAIRGSGAGAFGLPQFLPSSYLRFALDGNGDGRVSLYDPSDAIDSTANYLRSHGWRPGLTRDEQRRVVWAYNRSDAYIDTVLSLAERIEAVHPSRHPVTARRASVAAH